jgi:hypothetical protein
MWNGSPQRKLTTNTLSGMLGADHSELAVTAASAAYFDKALDTTAFAAGQNNGSLKVTWTI